MRWKLQGNPHNSVKEAPGHFTPFNPPVEGQLWSPRPGNSYLGLHNLSGLKTQIPDHIENRSQHVRKRSHPPAVGALASSNVRLTVVTNLGRFLQWVLCSTNATIVSQTRPHLFFFQAM